MRYISAEENTKELAALSNRHYMYLRSTNTTQGTVEMVALRWELSARIEQGGYNHNSSLNDYKVWVWYSHGKGEQHPGLHAENTSCRQSHVLMLLQWRELTGIPSTILVIKVQNALLHPADYYGTSYPNFPNLSVDCFTRRLLGLYSLIKQKLWGDMTVVHKHNQSVNNKEKSL